MALRVEDRLAITELLSRYGLLIDRHLMDEWTDLFTPDAEFDVPGVGTLRTVDDRRAMVEAAPKGLHLVAAPVITAAGSDRAARCQQEFLFRNVETGKFLTGWYEDEVVKEGDQWRFARRAIRYFRRAQTSPPPP